MVLIFFSRCHVFYPLFHLSGLPFSFFCKQSHFFSFINIFYSFSPFLSLIAISHHFLAFHCLSLPFLFFSPMSILHFPLFSRFLPFLNSFLSFLLFPPLPSFYTLFLPFFFRSSFIFSFLLMSLSPSHFSRFTFLKMFHVKHRFLQFSVFGDQ